MVADETRIEGGWARPPFPPLRGRITAQERRHGLEKGHISENSVSWRKGGGSEGKVRLTKDMLVRGIRSLGYDSSPERAPITDFDPRVPITDRQQPCSDLPNESSFQGSLVLPTL